MSVHIAEVTVDESSRVVVDHVPFKPGDRVEVVVRSRQALPAPRADLVGSVLRYDRPFDPVAQDDWEAAL